jgi:hypothetical protein
MISDLWLVLGPEWLRTSVRQANMHGITLIRTMAGVAFVIVFFAFASLISRISEWKPGNTLLPDKATPRQIECALNLLRHLLGSRASSFVNHPVAMKAKDLFDDFGFADCYTNGPDETASRLQTLEDKLKSLSGAQAHRLIQDLKLLLSGARCSLHE